jgi:fatty-acyl-CoA synthase
MGTFSERLRSLYQESPQRVVVTVQNAGQPDASMTISQLLSGAQGFADKLHEGEIKSGEVVILILQHGEELLHSYFGAVIHGAIPSIMPFLTEKLSPERYRADLSALVSITQPAAIITYADFEQEVKDALQEGSSVRKLIVADTVSPREVDASSWPGLARQSDAFASGRL